MPLCLVTLGWFSMSVPSRRLQGRLHGLMRQELCSSFPLDYMILPAHLVRLLQALGTMLDTVVF